MRSFVLLNLLLAAGPLFAAEPTALAALKLIPKERAAKLARIEARDGTPNPDRWYLIIQDPEDGNGVHEFVVANNEVVASRPISQFAEKLEPGDVIGAAAIKIDSDQLAKIARQYAQANNVTIDKINYELRKDGVDTVPMWKVTCLDESDKRVGEITVTAGRGNIVSHDGFPVVPQIAQQKKPAKVEVYADSQAAKPIPNREAVADDQRDAPTPREDDERPRRGIGQAFGAFGNTMKRVFTGH